MITISKKLLSKIFHLLIHIKGDLLFCPHCLNSFQHVSPNTRIANELYSELDSLLKGKTK